MNGSCGLKLPSCNLFSFCYIYCLRQGFPEADPKTGIGNTEFIWEGIPGSTREGVGMGDREGEEADRGCNGQITSMATGAHSPWGLQRYHPRHPVRGAETQSLAAL